MRGALAVVALAVSACGDLPEPVDAGRDASVLPALEVPIVPVGVDAITGWEDWPRLRVGTRTIMRSTYDRAGGNERADACHFVRADAPDRYVALDVGGPGALVFARANHWHGSPWHWQIDGADFVVGETTTHSPDMPVAGSTWEPIATFPAPLAETWSTTRGADLSWVPATFARSFVLAYERTYYGTGYWIVQRFPEDAENLSRPPETWDRMPPPPAAVELFARAGDDLSPPSADSRSGSVMVDGSTTVFESRDGARTVRALRFRAPAASAIALGRARLRITWDDRDEPSIDAPVALFFGAGTLYDRDPSEWLVRSIPVSVRTVGSDVELSAYWPMPYFRSMRVELESAEPLGVEWELRTIPYDGPHDHVGYLHATYVDHGAGVPDRDLVLLDTSGAEGSAAWCGSFVGTSFVFSEDAYLGTLEGDPRFYFDDSLSPQAHGTGTEEWGGGGDYWGGENMTIALAGHPVGGPWSDTTVGEDAIESAYRFLLADLFPFGRRARIELEHGPVNDTTERYRTVTLWYGLPGECLVLTDELDVGDPASESAHAYSSTELGAVETIRSRWAGGPLVEDERVEDGRATHGTTEMTLEIDPRNAGVLLRRTLDHALADQRAEVWIRDADAEGAFERAGTWSLAGSTAAVFSNPPAELSPAAPVAQESGRRLLEDEFLIAPRYTRGRSHVRVRFVFAPDARPLLPGDPPPPTAWSELRYRAYVWTLPPPP